MNITLPPPVASYFQAANAHDTMSVIAQFTDDAVVGDESHEHRGAAIEEWSNKVIEAYHPQAEVTDAVETSDGSAVTALVSGTFPGSPIEIRYHFSLRDEKISALRIEA